MRILFPSDHGCPTRYDMLSPMNPEHTILNIQQRLQAAFEMGPFGDLDYLPPAKLRKHGVSSVFGNILGKRSGHIWSSTWCFYQIRILTPPLDRYGAVNFICFSNNAQCGKGKHTDTVWDILAEFCEGHPRFSLNAREGKFAGLHHRYPVGEYSVFPEDEAFTDLKVLIEETYPKLNLLKV